MEQMLACIPKGNPTPSLVCTWNGMTFDLEVPQKATQNHTGTYCCMATNRLGSVSKDIAVVVQGDSNSPAARPKIGFGILIQTWKEERFQWAGGGEMRSGLGGLGCDSLALEPSQFYLLCLGRTG